MAGIYNPNMRQPENCKECPFGRETLRSVVCYGGKIPVSIEDPELYCMKNPPGCPLVSVPDHGGLIEKNAVFQLIQSIPSVDKQLPVEFMKALYELPTVIPADKN